MKKPLLYIALGAITSAQAMFLKDTIQDSIVKQYTLMNGDSITVKAVGYDSEKINVRVVGYDAERITIEARNIHFLSTSPVKTNALVTTVSKDLNTDEWKEQQGMIDLVFHNDSRSYKEKQNTPLRSLGVPLTIFQLKEIVEEYIKGNFVINDTGSVRLVTPKNNCGGRNYY